MKKHSMRMVAVLAITVLAVGSGLLSGPVGAGSPEAKATIKDAGGSVVGVAKLEQEEGYVSIKVSVEDLPAGFHGFHIHGVGDCAPFGDAGSHLGVVESSQSHPQHDGDLPVLLVMADGTGHLRFTTDRFTVATLLSGDRTAFIIHAAPDNYTDPATGAAGARIACGVIEGS